ncbi:RidA family protein [Histidinibacterium lentulum]|uniref:RidA family protein n=1 Tax=Histidinibacterium lentulum TaxID=2480588 RepID=A0A3N2R1A6_9RHOB|nr:RidA family protein [Histidinibacterium lentulum]ROU01244.1 RidA family protein [Histidinibacterium lentulum]
MANVEIRTDEAPKPNSAYAQAMEVRAGARVVHVSGQLGISPEGELAEGMEAQLEQAWRNVLAILKAADMTHTDIVDMKVFLTEPEGVPIARQVRDRVLGGHLAASTLLICGLANPAWKAEISVTAASDRS